MEYGAACTAGIPVLAYFLDENEPWPPRWIERERSNELQAFKKRVESEVTRKTFRNPDELGRLVTQALALYIERQRESTRSTVRFAGRSVIVDTAATLQSQPDVIIPIGTSEAGLPLLFCIRRSRDLGPHLEALASEMAGSSSSIETLLSSFKQSLETHGRQAWARDRLFPVSRADGTINELYVSRANLAGLFRSTLSLILDEAVAETRRKLASTDVTDQPGPIYHSAPRGQRDLDERSVAAGWHGPGAGTALQSEGGNNRFLGIDPLSGSIVTVGKKDGRWIEWRPFLHESIQFSIPEIGYSIDGRDHYCPVK